MRSGALPCKIPSAVGVAGGRRYRQLLNVRHAVFLSWTGRGTRLGSQSATAFRLHAASREIPLVRCCMLASVLRAKRRWLCPATATRLELRRPELCPLRHATPTKICTAGVRLSSQDRRAGGSPLTVANTMAALRCLLLPGVHIVVVQSALVPQSSTFQQTNQIAMIEIALHRISSRPVGCFGVRQEGAERHQPGMARNISRGWQDKSADVRRADMAGRVGEVGPPIKTQADNFCKTPSKSGAPAPSAFLFPWRTP